MSIALGDRSHQVLSKSEKGSDIPLKATRHSAASNILFRMSIRIGMLAIMVAGLVGIGQGSVNIPAVVSLAVVLSWIYTDWLRWIRIHRFFVYVAMIIGAGYAIYDYLGSVDQDQLYSVANMLVYAQVPLFFQEKSRRIFEQLGVFLLLELVVAALVNDNVFFGLLLVPTLAMGVSTLVLFACFMSIAQAGPRIKPKTPWFQDYFWSLLGKTAAATPRESIRVGLSGNTTLNQSMKLGWKRITFPMTVVLIGLAASYFYVLPRLNSGSYATGGFGRAMVGYTDSVSLQQVGRMLQNDRLVLRVEFRNSLTGELYEPIEPPYLRGVALNEYRTGLDGGTWVRGEYSRVATARPQRELISMAVAKDDFVEDGEFVTAIISEQGRLGRNAVSLPPFFRGNNPANLSFLRDCWEVVDPNPEEGLATPRRKYDLITQSFTLGKQSPLIPESEDVFEEESEDFAQRAAKAPFQDLSDAQWKMLTKFSPSRFIGLVRARDQALAGMPSDAGVIDRALKLEDYLANSGDFQYTLDLTQDRDEFLDPIEDFVVKQRKGHCQFFASSLAMMLRSMKIPTRVVVGFRPSDYNGVGDYFLVKQLHAHSWVEAYFTREQFSQTNRIELPSNYGRGAWLRFDPTPPGDGSNAGGTLRQPNQQAFDFAQQLWKDYVMNVDSSNRSELLSAFSSASGGAYQRFFLGIQAAILRMQQGQFVAGFLSLEQNFAWQVGLLVSVLLIILLGVWRLTIWFLPKRRSRIRYSKANSKFRNDARFEFFQKCMMALEAAGFRRRADQTPKEITGIAKARLATECGVDETDVPLEFLTDQYYRLRYGNVHAAVESDLNAELKSRSQNAVRVLKQFRKSLRKKK